MSYKANLDTPERPVCFLPELFRNSFDGVKEMTVNHRY